MNIVTTGLGLGLTMPVYLIAVLNAVPYSVLGVATSTNTFFRTVGGAFGLAIVGSVMNSSYLSKFTDSLPSLVAAGVLPEQLNAIADNPQALINPEVQAQLQSMFARLGEQGPALFNDLVSTLRGALNSALSDVFLVSFAVIIVALIVSFFLKESPMRKHN